MIVLMLRVWSAGVRPCTFPEWEQYSDPNRQYFEYHQPGKVVVKPCRQIWPSPGLAEAPVHAAAEAALHAFQRAHPLVGTLAAVALLSFAFCRRRQTCLLRDGALAFIPHVKVINRLRFPYLRPEARFTASLWIPDVNCESVER
jgi:hypothetical protein